jgi:hypothetical protein
MSFCFNEKDESTTREFDELLMGFSPIIQTLKFLNDSNLKEK